MKRCEDCKWRDKSKIGSAIIWLCRYRGKGPAGIPCKDGGKPSYHRILWKFWRQQ